ncbi:MAG TPA: GAF domain-containing SpoIIE family protein phosphatase [Bacteroidota bacterium]|nr:GAF domain-containing SpoIIE family protein phosphatase [Bacteroidota bacterium]
MDRLKRILYIFLPIVFFLFVFVLDVVNRSYRIEEEAVRYTREFLIVTAFLLLYLFMESTGKRYNRGSAKEIGRLLVGCIAVLGWIGVNTLFPAARFVEQEGAFVPFSATTILFSEILCIAVGIFSIRMVLSIRTLVMTKPKRGTKRMFAFLLIAVLLSSGAALPFIPVDIAVVGSIAFGAGIVLSILNSFKQNWIVYLSRREKIYTIVYSLLLFLGFVGLNIVLNERTFLRSSLEYFSVPLSRFVQLNAIFGGVYFGMSLFSTLFHLPTAEVYERKQFELSSLHNLSRLINQVFDFHDLVNTVTQMTLEVVGAKSAWLELVQEEKGEGERPLHVVSRKNISQEEIEIFNRAAGNALRQVVLDSKKVLSIDNVATDRRTKELKRSDLPVGSLLTVPLLSHGELIGFLHATKDFAGGFDQDDIEVLTTFCDNVTIAIENSKLIVRSIERERLQQEMMVAQQMQRRLLPQSLPVYENVEIAAISEPSLEVGGDYFDFVRIDDEKLGVVVGDVSGKGVSAAFYMAEVKGIFQSLSKVYPMPKEMLIHANETLLGSLERKAFISMVYGIIDTKRGILYYSRAGHCPPIYLSDGTSELLRPNGLGLGLTNGRLFEKSTEERIIRLKTGDICVFYTDGLAEARNSSGVELGYEGLLEIAKDVKPSSAHDIKQHIWSEVRNYMGGSTYTDDMTLVVIKWLGTSARPA